MTVCYWCGAKDALADVGKELDDGKYKMVQCQKCKNAYYVLNKEKTNKPKQMTNEEWLRSMTTEQLAEWIADTINDTVDAMSIDAWAGDVDRDDFWQRKSGWLEWLKQPHNSSK